MVMAERRKNKKKREADSKGFDEKPSKEEYAVAKYLRQKLPEKKTTLLGHKVEYFISSRAVDCLLESSWGKDKKKGELYFNNRDAVGDFMARLLEHKFFHRAKKIIVTKEPKKKKKDSEEAVQESPKGKDSKKSKGKSDSIDKSEEKDSKKQKGKSDVAEKGDEKDGKKSKGKSDSVEKNEEKDSKKEGLEVVEKKKEKKKIKLDMHLEQIFVDGSEAYVWIYDPIPLRTWITGTLMVIAAVLICLFPLWPQTIRHYIYYLSVAAAFFLVFIIGLAVLRLVVFVLVWVFTLGRHHLWLLPNLTEDVGFFESFWPLYKYEYKGNKEKDKKDTSSKEKQDKDKSEESKEESQEKDPEKSDASSTDQDKKADQNQSESEQEESEGEKPKTDNGFEFLEAEEVNECKTDDEETRKTK